MKRKLSFILLGCLMILAVGGCGKEKENQVVEEKQEVVLNDRQKQILKEAGLPLDYEELNSTQKRAIVAIDEMLTYAEEKYGIPFSYAGYIPPYELDGECTYAYPTDGDEKYDCFTIERDGEGFWDNYLNKAAQPCFMEYLSKEIREILPDTKFKVYGEITHTTLEQIPDENTDFSGKVSSIVCVIIDGASFNREVDEFKTELINYLEDHQLSTKVNLTILKEGEIKGITPYNYIGYASEDQIIYHETFYVDL